MSDPSQSVRVTIFGDEYSVKGDVDIETTRRVADYVNRKMTDLSTRATSRDKVKIAVLSALNIAGELFELISRTENRDKQMSDLERKAELIVRKIDENITKIVND